MKQDAITNYKQYWDEKRREEEAARGKLRLEALKTADDLKNILVKEFSVKKVILFGSALDEARFRLDSDLDLAVEGLTSELYFKALGRLIMASPFKVDLKPVEDAGELLKSRIARGRVLYEQGKNS
ncbi:MAG: nucleotidyltransferase domain-containing protein [Candidatus Schekmanbacteria bacterium]|nr:nucleotidyltransferase domain-containing protein [Candidatus Schekmanbacteria bacterium]